MPGATDGPRARAEEPRASGHRWWESGRRRAPPRLRAPYTPVDDENAESVSRVGNAATDLILGLCCSWQRLSPACHAQASLEPYQFAVLPGSRWLLIFSRCTFVDQPRGDSCSLATLAKPLGLTARTEHSTWPSTCSAVLPMNRPRIPVCRWVPMTTRSASMRAARSDMT